jgi:hypothetical protein
VGCGAFWRRLRYILFVRVFLLVVLVVLGVLWCAWPCPHSKLCCAYGDVRACAQSGWLFMLFSVRAVSVFWLWRMRAM